MKLYLYAGMVALLALSCSIEQDPATEEVNNKAVELPVAGGDGSVPRFKMVHSVYIDRDKHTLQELDKMYREDIKSTASDYDINLKNMWYTIINDKLIKDGDPAMKMFYIQEQINAKQNLPNINSFFRLLVSSKSFMNNDRIFDIASEFNNKNKDYIENVILWDTEEGKKQALDDLVYENVIFFRFMSTSSI